HTLAGKRHWMQLEGNAFGELDPSEARSYLITDANAYNSSIAQLNELMPGEAENRDKNNMDLPLSGRGMNWVSDLILDCDLTVADAKGQAAFELIDSGRQLRCTIDLTSGEATLSIGGLEDYEPKAQTKVKKAGTFAIGFANVDNKLYLWVDGRPVEFDSPTEYPSLGDRVPTEADLAPAAIGAAGGAELQVSHLKLHRDIYYIAMSRDDANRFDDVAMFETVDGALNRPDNRAEFFSNPEFWRDHAVDHARTIKNSDAFRNSRKREFPIGEDKYFMLGDNSARSADGRLWTVPDRGQDPDMGHTVDRKLMIGKALFIYWPHSFNEIPGLGIPFPMFPNFGDMKFVR
ncbi:MAG: S26 family signal peptidase, partial [Pirellulales bacterium]|nr:S26 family signal peptidase [Pirellulales bacterium]